jgi:hypothetical protein
MTIESMRKTMSGTTLCRPGGVFCSTICVSAPVFGSSSGSISASRPSSAARSAVTTSVAICRACSKREGLRDVRDGLLAQLLDAFSEALVDRALGVLQAALQACLDAVEDLLVDLAWLLSVLSIPVNQAATRVRSVTNFPTSWEMSGMFGGSSSLGSSLAPTHALPIAFASPGPHSYSADESQCPARTDSAPGPHVGAICMATHHQRLLDQPRTRPGLATSLETKWRKWLLKPPRVTLKPLAFATSGTKCQTGGKRQNRWPAACM